MVSPKVFSPLFQNPRKSNQLATPQSPTKLLKPSQAQTPAQKRANAKFAKSEEKRMGRPESATKKKDKASKAPISTGWIVLLAFVVGGSLLFELLRLFPVIWDFVASFGRDVLAVFK